MPSTLFYERAMVTFAERIEATLNQDEPPVRLLVAYDLAADNAGVSDAVRQETLVDWRIYKAIQARRDRNGW